MEDKLGWSFKGWMGLTPLEEETVVLALNWPSWWLVLNSLGLKKVSVVTKERLKEKSF